MRCRLRLSLVEREEISRGLAAGESLRGDRPSFGSGAVDDLTEVNRNGGRMRYRACPAERALGRRAKRPKPAKLATCERLRVVVEDQASSSAGRRSRSLAGCA